MKRKRLLTVLKSKKKPRTTKARAVSRIPARLTTKGSETKSIDTVNGQYALNTTGTVNILNAIAPGSSYFNRVGRRIEMKSLQMKGWLKPIPAQDSPVTQTGRIIIVYDRQTNGAAPVYADVIKSQGAILTSTSSEIKDFINLDNRDRFQIIRDIEFCLPSCDRAANSDVTIQGVSTHGNGTGEAFQFNEFIKLKGLVTQYKADSANPVVGDVATGGLFILSRGNAAAGGEGWLAELSFRLRYKDN